MFSFCPALSLCFCPSLCRYQETFINLWLKPQQTRIKWEAAGKQVSVAQRGYRMVFMSVCGTRVCVYLWQQPFWCYEVTLLQPQTCIGYWFHVLVLSGSVFGCKALTAAQENTGGDRLADVRHINTQWITSVCWSVWVQETLKFALLSRTGSDAVGSLLCLSKCFIQKTQKHQERIHPSFIFTAYLVWGRGGAGACPCCHWAGGGANVKTNSHSHTKASVSQF